MAAQMQAKCEGGLDVVARDKCQRGGEEKRDESVLDTGVATPTLSSGAAIIMSKAVTYLRRTVFTQYAHYPPIGSEQPRSMS